MPAFAACTDPEGVPGELMYNGTYDVFQGCTTRGWMAFSCGSGGGGGGGLSGPAGCPAIGDACPDTTIFAGFDPMTQDHLFIPPTDQGTTMQWKNATGTNDINPDSFVDGRLNHANRSGAIADFPAFKACEDLTLAGKSWYLPSRAELDYLYNNRSAYVAKAPGNGFTNFQNAYYWSSTEYNNSNSWYPRFTDGYIFNSVKTNSYRVRCVGR